MDIATIIQLIVSGLAAGAIYGLVAQGFYIAFRITNTLNFGQGDFLMLGCFVTLLFIHMGLPFYVILILLTCFMAIMGVILERVAIRPVARAGLSFILTTMGFAMLVQNTIILTWGNKTQPFPSFFGGGREKAIRIAGIGFFPEEIFVIVSSLIVMIVFFIVLRKTIVGKAFSAVSYDPDTASILGINVKRMKILAYVIASVLAGIGGFLIGPISTVEPFMGFRWTLKALVAAILGGFLNPVGILVGGLTLGLIENLASIFTSQYRDLISFLIIIIVLVFRPSGLFREQNVGRGG